MKSNVLIVDDDLDTLDSLSDFLVRKGYATDKADSIKAAQVILSERQIDAVLLDMRLPDGNGLDWVPVLREQHPHQAIILITGIGDIPTAVEAMRRGADHFITKPVNPEELVLFLGRCLEVERLRQRDFLRRRILSRTSIYRGESRLMQNAWQLAETAAENEAAVLLLGETGTGKGVFARWIHDHGPRQDAPYVELNCSSLRGELLASELFGHRKGAFTSAVENREGLIEAANGGTLFLDEISDMDLGVQAQFLKVIEEKEYRRVGESKQRHSEFRLICATNGDLPKESDSGRIRKDLYFRICVFPIGIPSLRQYAEDLPGLIDHTLASLGRLETTVTPEALQLLKSYSWPGNIREVRNVLERACLLAKGAPLDVRHFPGLVGSDSPTFSNEVAPSDWSVDAHEAQHLRNALAHFNGDVSKAARALGIGRATFYRKLKNHPDASST